MIFALWIGNRPGWGFFGVEFAPALPLTGEGMLGMGAGLFLGRGYEDVVAAYLDLVDFDGGVGRGG